MPSIQRPNSTPRPSYLPGTPPRLPADENQVAQKKRSVLPSTSPITKRLFLRRTFDFYEDQTSFVKHESLQERLAGKEQGMNEVVREAIDDWIRKRESPK